MDRSRDLETSEGLLFMKKYNVIYADPPWSYDNKSMKYVADDINRAVVDQYDLMSLQDIKDMPIKQISDRNCALFMWCVNPMLQEALDVMKAWGFKYKTMLTWEKDGGTGYWFMGKTEHILFGVRGNVKAFRSGLPNFHSCKRGKHSQKPQHFRSMISKVVLNSFDNPNKLELFARSRENLFPDYEYEGWDVYGNQVNNSIELPNG